MKYSARGNGFQLFLTSDETVLALNQPSTPATADTGEQQDPQVAPATAEPSGAKGRGAVLRMKLIGANGRARVTGEDELAAKSNYFVGAGPESWHTGLAMFEKIRYAEVYPGVDVVYYGNQRQLEYDFIVAPQVDPARIKFKFSCAREVRLDAEGHLLLQAGDGHVRQEKPVLYQLVEGRRQEVAGRYALKDNGEIGFAVGDYDRSQPLVIDPVLSYSTYLGGSGNDQALGIALDQQGNAYVTGQTNSADFPTAGALQTTIGDDISTDAFVLKLNAGGDGGATGGGDRDGAGVDERAGVARDSGVGGGGSYRV